MHPTTKHNTTHEQQEFLLCGVVFVIGARKQ